jgi:hypothetical protein
MSACCRKVGCSADTDIGADVSQGRAEQAAAADLPHSDDTKPQTTKTHQANKNVVLRERGGREEGKRGSRSRRRPSPTLR